jgi:hypothetical protein
MADQLFLSYELRGFTAQNMVRHLEKVLRLFPYSRLSERGALLRIQAISTTEPPLFEQRFEDPPGQIDEILNAVKEYAAPDCAAFLEVAWDIWTYDGEWKLTPSVVVLACFGPRFESDSSDNLRIEFGMDTPFLPQSDLPNSLFMARSNVRSLLHLVHEIDRTFVINQRRLWTETGQNFAETLQAALVEAGASE